MPVTTTTTTTTTTITASGKMETTTVTTSGPASSPAAEEGVAPVADLTTVLDEAGAAVLGMLPPKLLDLSDVQGTRAGLDGLLAAMPAPEMPDDVDVSEKKVPGHLPDDPEVRVKIYRPKELAPAAPGMYWIHGGGMVLGSADMDDFACAMQAKAHGCLVVSVDYRLAPETAAPGLVRRHFLLTTIVR